MTVTAHQWSRLERLGLVALVAEPDDDPDLSFLDDDKVYTPEERAEQFRQIERDGVWGVVGKYKWRGRMHTSDSVWGFIGYKNVLSDEENVYVPDIKRATIAELRKAIRERCRHCMGTGIKS